MKFTIDGKLPSLNEIIEANRTNRYVGAKQKRDAEKVIAIAIRKAKLPRIYSPITLTYKWYEANERRDADNIVTAQKFVQDAMVNCGIIPDDNRRIIKGFSHEILVDKNHPRIEVEINVCE